MRRRLQLVLLTTDHLNDVMAGLAFLKRLDGVDAERIAVAGHSFAGETNFRVTLPDRAAESNGGRVVPYFLATCERLL